jgi:hypothetical protein
VSRTAPQASKTEPRTPPRERSAHRALQAVAVAAFLAVAAPLAGEAAIGTIRGAAPAPDSSVLKVHGFHQHCARDRYGWHRHNQWGERRLCRRWRGYGPRPDFCIQIGPIWICEY